MSNYTKQIEENGAEFLIALGRAAGAEERQEAHIHWVIGNSPIDYHNAVVRCSTKLEQIEAEIVASQACMQRHQVPGTWHVGPAMQPADLGDRLTAYGFTYAGDDIGMAVELSQVPRGVVAPQGFQIRRVANEQALNSWVNTLAQGFGEGRVEAEWVGDMYRRNGLEQPDTWRHYVGYLTKQPVATASLYLAAGVAGIYFVMTIPQARRQGIGTAITLAALQDAQKIGYQVGVLGSSAMGVSVYRQLGFQEYCRIGIYEWHPKKGTSEI